jgi:magnesium-transporting ATPase (P-type)
MKILSLTHECVREKAPDGSFFYRGPSPDEVQLVEFAKDMGFVFMGDEAVDLILQVGQK